MKYEPVIGLEVHLQLKTKTKAFCGCSTLFGQRPNSQSCPVCLGLPGSLPKLNHEAFGHSIKVALALHCSVQKEIKFDRKNYYYPDLPKNFQISQYDKPVAHDGFVDISSCGKIKKIRIKRVHLEEDAGKLIHQTGGPYSLFDCNRAGMPLLEIVTEPDINSPEEAYDYLTGLKSILKYLEVSDCDMEKGSLRCDANISVRPAGSDKLGSKVELKNMNSFKAVRLALEHEVSRQMEAVSAGEKLQQETRLWDAGKAVTLLMRTKEEAHDYRYFPEPDLVPFVPDPSYVEDIRKTIPEMPDAKAKRFKERFNLSDYDIAVLVSDKAAADYFEKCLESYDNPKTVANWIMGDITAQSNLKNTGIRELGISPQGLAELLKMIDGQLISGKMAKEVLLEAIEKRCEPAQIVRSKGLEQLSDKGELEKIVKVILGRNEKSVQDYKGGKKNALTFIIGQVMRETKGKANPAVINEILKKSLGE
ncbi:MAG: Asp-tRNA(Asn)/Glu-tRNA(Gln) amidotransferase subunit GatB [Candidatus Omnitrophica bacterium]|nr:Asp-tRNA(Asn)/Glu-tRNA(Gln) amidotransferase subunit GatB [Candidatus Omnitrophota bacterium]